MTINELIKFLQEGNDITILNTPFSYIGEIKIVLKGDENRFWMFGENDALLAIAPEDEEIIHFEKIDDDIEPGEDVILYRSKEYEFSYSDNGVSVNIEGDVGAEENDSFAFSDYEAGEGARLRVITNENTGEYQSFLGQVVVVDDIIAVE